MIYNVLFSSFKNAMVPGTFLTPQPWETFGAFVDVDNSLLSLFSLEKNNNQKAYHFKRIFSTFYGMLLYK